jgi:hypothetical protein
VTTCFGAGSSRYARKELEQNNVCHLAMPRGIEMEQPEIEMEQHSDQKELCSVSLSHYPPGSPGWYIIAWRNLNAHNFKSQKMKITEFYLIILDIHGKCS